MTILPVGSPGSSVRLHLNNLGGKAREVFLTRLAWDKKAISWSKTVMPLRVWRQEEI